MRKLRQKKAETWCGEEAVVKEGREMSGEEITAKEYALLPCRLLRQICGNFTKRILIFVTDHDKSRWDKSVFGRI